MWEIMVFAKRSDEMLRVLEVDAEFSIFELADCYGVDVTQPTYGSYRVTRSMAAVLSKHVIQPIDTQQYDYFLEFVAP